MSESQNLDLTLTAAADAPMTEEQRILLKRLAREAFDFEAYGSQLSQAEASRRISGLRAKIALQGEPPHTQ